MKKFISIWLILMLAGIFTAGCAYISTQQSLRSGADGPAVTAVRQAMVKLENGETPQNALPEKTDIRTSQTPFVYIYDSDKNLVASSAAYGSESIAYPVSVLSEIDKRGENRVTWQPKTGLRFATVGIQFVGGYIIGCYPLSETENTISHISALLLIGSALYAVGSAVILGVAGTFMGHKKD